MAEKLNKEREGRTDKVMKKKKQKKKKEKERTKSRKKERLLGNFCHCIHACLSLKKKKKKRISKLWILGRKESFCFFVDLKKNGWKQTLSPPTPPPVEGRIQVDRREGKKDTKKWEVGRDLKGRETRVRRWMRDRFLQNNFTLYICQL